MSKPLQTYETDDIVVTFDPNICRHTGICLRGLPAVFDVNRKRWVSPERASASEVDAQVRRCPSGALQSRLKGDANPNSQGVAMSRLIHFEIHASDPERLLPFYTTLFGWSAQKWAGPADYWLLTTGLDSQPGINGGLMRRMGPPPADGQPVNAFVCTVQVDSLDAILARSGAAGGTLALPKMAVPGVGWLAYVKDPDGNILGLMQPDPAAK